MALLLLLLLAAATTALPVQLDPFGDHSIRVRVAPDGGSIVDPPIQALNVGGPTVAQTTRFSYGVTTTGLFLTNGNLRVDIDNSTGLVTATRVSDGAVLLQQTLLHFGPPMTPVSKKPSYGVNVSFAGHGSNERIYGLGEHRTGKVNQMGFDKEVARSHMYGYSSGADVSIPWYCSSLGYGFVWNSPAYGHVSLNANSLTWISYAQLNADFWITTTSPENISAPYAELLNHHVDAVGHASRMPFDVTGFIQCKNRYRNQTQLLNVARGYVERMLPLSVITIDYMHWKNFGDWSFNPTCWPDPSAMTQELDTLGVRLMVSLWPSVSPSSTHWQEFKDNNYIFPLINGTYIPYDWDNQYMYDAFNPAARTAVWNGFYAGYGVHDIHRVWLDAAEPEGLSDATVGQWMYSAGTDGEVGMAWVRHHVQTFADGFASIGVNVDNVFTLPRHAWSGSWRYGAALWSGDIPSNFGELSTQVRVLQGVMLSGVTLWTTDIGGYGGGNPSDPTFQELIVRWFQFGAFCPLFRLHGDRAGGPPSDECGSTDGDNEIWNLAKDPDHYNSIVTVMRLRENLRFYVTEINEIAAATGLPMVRPMFLQFPSDATCQTADVEDQFMFGPNWLVAPVLQYQATSRTVYLPPLVNETWVYYYNDSSVGPGGGRVTMPTPIGEFPLFYRRAIPTPPPTAVAQSLYCSTRQDTVTCVTDQCHQSNRPGGSPDYEPVNNEGIAWLSAGDVQIGGATYTLAPLSLWFSYTLNDNYVADNSHPPSDPSYQNVTFNDGYVLPTQAPGSIPLQMYSNGQHHATLACNASIASYTAKGFKYLFTVGYVLPAQ